MLAGMFRSVDSLGMTAPLIPAPATSDEILGSSPRMNDWGRRKEGTNLGLLTPVYSFAH